MKRAVYEIVREKREWQCPPEPEEAAHEATIGSKGWHTRGYLPHFDKPGTVQMVTFRLADAMPASLRHEWEDLFVIEDEREQRTKLEAYLDKGHGECVLRDGRVAAAVEEVFLRFDQSRYRLMAWVVMPNHVHVLFEMWDMPLGKLLKAWKGTSANAANTILERSGELWQAEYWDRYMRDENHFRKARRYIENNPVKAHLARAPEDWLHGSANPKWQWSAQDRYLRGHLLNAKSSQSNAESEHGHSCPQVPESNSQTDETLTRGQECPRSSRPHT